MLTELAKLIQGSAIWRLTYGGNTIGFRAKVYNLDSSEYDYYDFDAEIIKHIPSYLKFFKDKSKNMKSYELESVNGMLYTKDELNGEYEAKEILSKKEAENLLRPVILLYVGGVLSV